MQRTKREINLEDILIDKKQSEDLLEVQLSSRVFKFFLIIFCLICITMILYLIIIFSNYPTYQKIALQNINQSYTVFAKRGKILDRFGVILASNQPVYRLNLLPDSLPKDPKLKLKIFQELARSLNLNISVVEQKFNQLKDSASKICLVDNLDKSIALDLRQKDLPGVQIELGWNRKYSDSLVLSHVLGYLSLADQDELQKNPNLDINDLVGKTGLEKYYDSYLRGRNGRKLVFRDAQGKVLGQKIVKAPVSGRDLPTFIDLELQKYFYSTLKQRLAELNLTRAVGIAVDPNSGEILALVSLPSFDLNQVSKFLKQKNQPLFNRAVSGLYSPGSTIKPLIAIAGLNEKIISSEESIYCSGKLVLENPYGGLPTIFRDWKAHQETNLYSALAKSCNVYFYRLGGGYRDFKGLGAKKLIEYFKKFNLDKPTQIDIPGEVNGNLPEVNSKWTLGNTYNISIGQGEISITPLELISYISAIANRGKILKLRISKAQNFEILSQLNINSFIFKEIERGMVESVSKPYGTARMLQDLPFKVAAKTGSVEVRKKQQTNAIFVGYAPVDNPQIVILILIENSKEGSLNTLPVAKKLFNWYYQHRLKKD